MGPLGWQETVAIFLLALLLFGPKKLPELGRTIGKAITEFRRASTELKATFDREMKTLEQETESIRKRPPSISTIRITTTTPRTKADTRVRMVPKRRFHCFHPIHFKRIRN